MFTRRLRPAMLILVSLLLGQLLLTACGNTPSTPILDPTATTSQAAPTEVPTPTPTVLPAASTVTAAVPTITPSSAISGKFPVNGRSLYIECSGTGSPTVILENGEDQGGTEIGSIYTLLAGRTMTCTYDRANTGSGQSGTAPTPRTAQDIANDLHALLAAADVPGPYLLVGVSAGGLLVQYYARTFPEQVAGLVAANPVPPAHPWLDEVAAVFTPEELADETAYYNGENGESLDYATSSEQLTNAASPPAIPFELLISTDKQCEGDGESICLKSYTFYEQIERDLAASWPKGAFSQVASGHFIHEDDPDVLLAAVERALQHP